MLYKELKIKDNTYKLRLDAQNCIALEKDLKTNPLNILTSITEDHLPSLEPMIKILHYSLQKYQHNISLNDTYAIYDDFVDEGNGLEEFIEVIVDIFKTAGFIKEDNQKNA